MQKSYFFLALALWLCMTPHAALILEWNFNSGNGTDSAPAGANVTLNLPGSSANPTYLATGGKNGSGAFQFDGVDDQLIPSSVYDMGNGDWTVSFWIKTTDSGGYNGYEGTLPVNVIGDTSSAIGFGLGVDNGKATFTHYYSGWRPVYGTTNVANNVGHTLTFVHKSSNTIDIYVDGLAEVIGAYAYDYQYAYVLRNIGVSYGPKYSSMILDNLLVYDEALTSTQILQLGSAVPEMSSLTLLILGLASAYGVGKRNGKK